VNPHALAVAFAVLGTTVAQLLLRAGSRHNHTLGALFNPVTLLGYLVLFCVTILMVYALHGVYMRTLVIWNSSTYVLIPVASSLLFGERLTGRKVVGATLIVLGILLYSM